MKVRELIGLLSKLPPDTLVFADYGGSDDADITDVLEGKGTINGTAYIKLDKITFNNKWITENGQKLESDCNS